MTRDRMAGLVDRGLEGLLILLLVFAPLAFGAVEIWAREVLRIGALLLAVLALTRLSLGPKEPGRRSWLWVPVLAFVALVLLTILPLPRTLIGTLSPEADRIYSATVPEYQSGVPVDRESWLLGGSGQPEDASGPAAEPAAPVAPGGRTLSVYPYATLNELTLLLAHLVVFWVAFRFLDHRAARRVAWSVAAVAIFIGLLGLAQSLSGSQKIYFLREIGPGAEPLGPFVNRNHFAGYMELAIPLILGLLLGRLRKGLRSPGGSSRARDMESSQDVAQALLLGLMVAICLAALVLSFSRGGLLAIVIVLLVFLGVLLRRSSGRAERWAALLLLVGIVVAGLILAAPLARDQDRGFEAFSSPGAEPSWQGRAQAWKGTWEMFRAYPLAGSGMGTYRHAFPPFAPEGSPSRWFQAHNDFLQFLAEAGLAGALLLLAGVLLYFRWLYRQAGSGSERDAPLILGLLLALLGLSIHTAVDFNLQIPSNGLTFAALAGIVGALLKPERSPGGGLPDRRSPVLRLAAVGALAVLAGGLIYGVHAVRKIRADQAVSAGITAVEEDRTSDAVGHFRRSCELEPASAAHWIALAETRSLEFDLLEGSAPDEKLRDVVGDAMSSAFAAANRNPVASLSWQILGESFLQRSRIGERKAVINLDSLREGVDEMPTRDERLARAALERALVLDPRDAEALGQAGYLAELAGDREGAAELYSRALESNPLPEAHVFLEGQPPRWVVEAARRGARRAYSEGALVADHRLSLLWARFLNDQGALPEAREEYQAAAASAPRPEDRARFLASAGLLSYRMGRAEEAHRELEEAYEAGVIDSAVLLEALGRLRRKAGDSVGAEDALSRAMALRPRPDVALALAELQEENGNIQAAEWTLREAIRIAPGRVEPYLALADLLRRNERELSARAIENDWEAWSAEQQDASRTEPTTR